MKYFEYTVKDAEGLGAQSAGQIMRIARQYPDTAITVSRDSRKVDALKLMKLLSLGVREGDTLTVSAEGADEVEASIALRNYFQNNL